MKLTATQFQTLCWLSNIGGSCIAWRDKVVSAQYQQWNATWKSHRGQAPLDGSHAYTKPAVSALFLVQYGLIEARDGKLHITDKGRMHIEPFKRSAA